MKKTRIIPIFILLIIIICCSLSLVACHRDYSKEIVKQFNIDDYVGKGSLLLYDDGSFCQTSEQYDGYLKNQFIYTGTYDEKLDNQLILNVKSENHKSFLGEELLTNDETNYIYSSSLYYKNDTLLDLESGDPIFYNTNSSHDLILEELSDNLFTIGESPIDLSINSYYTDGTTSTSTIDNIDTSKVGIFYLNNNKNLQYFVSDNGNIIDQHCKLIQSREIYPFYQELYDNFIFYKGQTRNFKFVYDDQSLQPTSITGFSTDECGKFKMTVKYKDITRTVNYEVFEKDMPLEILADYNFENIPMITHKKGTSEYKSNCELLVDLCGNTNMTPIPISAQYIENTSNIDENIGISGANVVYKNSVGEAKLPVAIMTFDDNSKFLTTQTVSLNKSDIEVSIDESTKLPKFTGDVEITLDDVLGEQQTFKINQNNVLKSICLSPTLYRFNIKIHHNFVNMDYYFNIYVNIE